MGEGTIHVAATAGTPGAFMVDVFPFRTYSIKFNHGLISKWSHWVVKHVPDWFPGSGFKKQAKIWNKVTTDCAEEPFRWVKESMVS